MLVRHELQSNWSTSWVLSISVRYVHLWTAVIMNPIKVEDGSPNKQTTAKGDISCCPIHWHLLLLLTHLGVFWVENIITYVLYLLNVLHSSKWELGYPNATRGHVELLPPIFQLKMCCQGGFLTWRQPPRPTRGGGKTLLLLKVTPDNTHWMMLFMFWSVFFIFWRKITRKRWFSQLAGDSKFICFPERMSYYSEVTSLWWLGWLLCTSSSWLLLAVQWITCFVGQSWSQRGFYLMSVSQSVKMTIFSLSPSPLVSPCKGVVI